MNKKHSSTISDDIDEYPQVTQADIDRAIFRIGLKPASKKQQIIIQLDANIVEYLKAKAGQNDYQILINDILWQAMKNDNQQLQSEASCTNI